MKEIEVTVRNRNGIHVRPASLFATTANNYRSEVKVIKESRILNGKEVMNLIMLSAPQGTILRIEADGPDEQEALEALYDLVMVKTFNEE